MRAVDLITKKRDGLALSTHEINWLIAGYTRGEIADYQMAAWAMAVLFQGMDDRETADLTLAMARSGDLLDLHDVAPITVDKHSTGGVGDKTSLVLGPLVAAAGLRVAKMSGRGLGFSGGTLDKLESIAGFKVDLSVDEFRQAVREVGLVIAGQTADLAPADKHLYALRDVTGTVESIPLIAASVMSKKLAAGADCIVLDVKVGRGAFMKTVDQARELAQRMVAIGEHADRKVAAVITSMEQPLGYAIGNALEIKEAIATLQGRGPADFVELCLALGTQLVLLAGTAQTPDEARALLQTALDSGAAWHKFRAFVAQQGGDVDQIDDPNLLPQATTVEPIFAPREGYITAIDALELGMITSDLGGGRRQKDDPIDPSVGIVLEQKVGAFVPLGAPIATVHADQVDQLAHVHDRVVRAFRIEGAPPTLPPLIYEVVYAHSDRSDTGLE